MKKYTIESGNLVVMTRQGSHDKDGTAQFSDLLKALREHFAEINAIIAVIERLAEEPSCAA